MVAILTDTPLEEIMEHAPPRGYPYLENETLVHGCIKLAKCDNIIDVCQQGCADNLNQRINKLMHTDIDWHVYMVADDLYPKIDIRLFLFVYWYLAKGDNIAIYLDVDMPPFGPETMTSHIDISVKKPGMTPMWNCHKVFEDVIYHFTDSSKTAHLHDTTMLDRMGEDEYFDKDHFQTGRIPHDDLSLDELMKLAGNCLTYTTVYDYEAVMSTLNSFGGICSDRERNALERYATPLELITSFEKYWEWKKRGWQGPPMTQGPSKYGNCLVRMYCLYSSSSVGELSKICLRGEPVDNNLIGMVALVDTKNVKQS
ncbi:hypothetical protein [Candidatus Methanomassiliicoccus intestinalis]|uniref:hypothetical protein n=1 Tax=Candidatus Methanomassiliicoccus intestinalis TaxID=1406512 RepID=UPI0037DD17BD